ncbi:AAA family ATPase [Shewanella surugensis]|uniref:AAA family ATPase n=1 Tax=Shewanella surugensis TaxID=212020 RepID=A0ABT0LJN7_9GAMM|nr:AAA family ATPase [Shewanella surugensis]MCL1127585.1 AAA family ATPase [Shewanella surugensis]
MNHKHQLIVLTGGPGSGKTSVINALQARGLKCMDEVGRQVIQSEMLKSGQGLPWVNKTQFRDLMLKEELFSYQVSQHFSERIFFDRGVIDCYGYSLLENLALTDELIHACENNQYHKTVFIFPPWRAIYTRDTSRCWIQLELKAL